MITAVFPDEVGEGRIKFVPQFDHTYNMDRWISSVTRGVTAVSKPDAKIGLIGHSKDASSFYLQAFPKWKSVNVGEVRSAGKRVDATTVRVCLFEGHTIPREILPTAVQDWLSWDWLDGDGFKKTRAEHLFVQEYKEQWKTRSEGGTIPYPVTFFTADAVVTQAGHILLVKRRDNPGKGLWALPGGFINQHESVRGAAIRELREETRLTVPEPVLYGSITKEKLYDDPWRSQRGRTVTVAQRIELQGDTLPKVKGSDDAEKAQWVPLGDVKRNQMFEDHFDIIEDMVGI
jgi:bifunctional NMN adenylyltransferase/nudix hydrolase